MQKMLDGVKERHLKLWDDYEASQSETNKVREAKAISEINAGKVTQEAQDEKEAHRRDLDSLTNMREKCESLQEENEKLRTQLKSSTAGHSRMFRSSSSFFNKS